MAPPLSAAAVALAVLMSPLQSASAEHSKQHMVVCNGYADANAAIVGERPKGWRPLLGEAAMRAADHANEEGAFWAEPSSSSSAASASGLNGFLQQPLSHGQSEAAGGLAATSRHSPTPAVATSFAGAGAASKRTAPAGAGAGEWHPHSHGAVRSYIRRLRQSAAFLRPSGGAIWTRSLAYGACEEYFVDLSSRSLFFLAPDGLTECDFAPAEAIEDEEVDATVSGASATTPPSMLVAVITKPWAKSEACAARAVAVPSEEAAKEEDEALRGAKQAARPAAEVVTIDAFTPSHASAAAVAAGIGSLFEDAAHNHSVNASVVSSALVGVGGASLRLEDVVEDSSITSEVIASQSLDFGGASRVDARSYHVVLEDIRGISLLDHRQTDLEAGDVLIAARIGRGDDAKDFPERLLLFRTRPSES